MIRRWESRYVSVVSPGTPIEQRSAQSLGRHLTRAGAERQAFRLPFCPHGWGYVVDRRTGDEARLRPPRALR